MEEKLDEKMGTKNLYFDLILASCRNFKLDVGKGREQISETLKIHNRRLLFKSNGVMLCDKALAFLRLI